MLAWRAHIAIVRMASDKRHDEATAIEDGKQNEEKVTHTVFTVSGVAYTMRNNIGGNGG